jgi:hypothetical protein
MTKAMPAFILVLMAIMSSFAGTPVETGDGLPSSGLSQPSSNKNEMIQNAVAPEYAITYYSSLFWSTLTDQYVEGAYAYCGTETGLVILDVSDPADVSVVSQLRTGSVGTLAKQDSLLLFSASDGLYIVDVSDPAAPDVLTTYAQGGNYLFVQDSLVIVSGSYVYGFSILSIGDPTNPTEVGSYTSTVEWGDHHTGFYVQDSLVYMLREVTWPEMTRCLEIAGISDPTNPDSVACYCDTGLFLGGIVVSDSLAFFYGVNEIDWLHGFQVHNIADPTQPVFVGDYWSFAIMYTHGFYDLDVRDSIVYMSHYAGHYAIWGDLDLINVADPTSPILCGQMRVLDPVGKVHIHEGLAYYPNGTISYPRPRALRIVDISDPTNPSLEGTYEPGPASRSCIVDSLAYVRHGNTLSIIDFSDPWSGMDVVGTYEPGGLGDIVIRDSLAYLAASSGRVLILNVGDPTSPTLVGEIDLPGSVNAIDVQDGIAAVANWDIGLLILDVSDPTSPDTIGGFVGNGQGRDVIIRDTLVFMADGRDVRIIDISDPTNPSPISEFDEASIVYELALQKDLLHFAHHNRGYYILDVSDPTNPTVANSIDLGTVVSTSRILMRSCRSTPSGQADQPAISAPRTSTCCCQPTSGWRRTVKITPRRAAAGSGATSTTITMTESISPIWSGWLTTCFQAGRHRHASMRPMSTQAAASILLIWCSW